MKNVVVTAGLLLVVHLVLWMYLPAYRYATWLHIPSTLLTAAGKIRGAARMESVTDDAAFLVLWLGGFFIVLFGLILGIFLPSEK